MNINLVNSFTPIALEILAGYGYSNGPLEYLGAGKQSLCFGMGDVALLIHQGLEIPAERAPTARRIQRQPYSVSAAHSGRRGDHPPVIARWWLHNFVLLPHGIAPGFHILRTTTAPDDADAVEDTNS